MEAFIVKPQHHSFFIHENQASVGLDELDEVLEPDSTHYGDRT